MNQVTGQISDRASEVQSKLEQLRKRMAARQLDAVLLNQIPNAAWITAGAATYVNEAADGGASSILVTPDRAYVLTDTIEGPRLRQEEHLEDLGFEFVTDPWFARGEVSNALTQGKRVGQDSAAAADDVSLDLRDLRTVFMPQEIARLRRIGALASEVVNEAIRAVRPGDSEYKLAAALAAGSRVRGGTAIVNLIASDDRISQFRHPLPTAKTIEHYAMAVLCLRIAGLVVSVTRLVHFGPLPQVLRDKAMAVARVDAKVITGTRAGRTFHDMFDLAKRSYEAEGYPEAINEHHQGGSAGYSPREIIAVPNDMTLIENNQAFAWNPSVKGSKSEDTIILTDSGVEVLTTTPGWPMWDITVEGDTGSQTIQRPAILEA
ncbi:MAG: M24 family metallopeptidase [Chloroflexota bacterium]